MIAATHHTALTTFGVEKPPPLPSWWQQWRRKLRCRELVGHCWHPEGMVDWFCCECGAETDGSPPHRCVYCPLEEL